MPCRMSMSNPIKFGRNEETSFSVADINLIRDLLLLSELDPCPFVDQNLVGQSNIDLG